MIITTKLYFEELLDTPKLGKGRIPATAVLPSYFQPEVKVLVWSMVRPKRIL